MAIERAMAKRPEERFESMNELASELEACLAELDPGSEEATMIARRPVAPARQMRQDRPRRRRGGILWPIAAVLAILAIGALAALGAMALREDGGGGSAATNPAIRLAGIGAYDPEGGDGEHDDEAPEATDRISATSWRSSTYRSSLSSFKEGVGLVLEASREVEPKTITLTTTTPGFTAEIRTGTSPSGPFEQVVSDSQTIQARTVFELNEAKARYFLVWITEIPAGTHAEINEITAR